MYEELQTRTGVESVSISQLLYLHYAAQRRLPSKNRKLLPFRHRDQVQGTDRSEWFVVQLGVDYGGDVIVQIRILPATSEQTLVELKQAAEFPGPRTEGTQFPTMGLDSNDTPPDALILNGNQLALQA